MGTEKQLKNEQIVVLGSGIGGLLAAGVAARNFGRVIVVEKDDIPEEPLPRKGVPQGPQIHAIIKRGENAITGIFPEFPERLREAGAMTMAVGPELRVYEGGGWHPQRDVGLTLFTQTRALFEHVIRDLLLRRQNVVLQTSSRFVGLDLASEGSIKAVRIKSVRGEKEESISANLVIDAMGRGSPMPKWLKDHGHGSVRYSRAGIDLHYVTMLIRRTDAYRDAGNGWVIRATAPHHKRGATMFPIEGGRWILALVSRFGDSPPLDFEGCLEFARMIEGGVLYDIIKDAEVTTQPQRFMIPEALLAHFEEMEDLPVGLLPLGDVIGNFNPVMAQGMTISALHAEILDECLMQQSSGATSLADFSRDYISQVVAVSKAAWQAAVNGDFVYPETTGQRPPDLAEQQNVRRAVREMIETDVELHRNAVRVQQMLLPSTILARPDVLKRARNLG